MAIKKDTLYHDYTLILTTLNERPVGEIVAVTDFNYSPALIEIGELTFSLPRTYVDPTGVEMTTPLYNELDADMLLEINGEDYYYINTCQEVDSEGVVQKQIHAYSREYELAMKSFNDYETETGRFLFFQHPSDTSGPGYPWETVGEIPEEVGEFIESSLDSEGVPFGLFNTIERMTSWKLKKDQNGHPALPEHVKTEVREISTSETNMLELMKIIQEAWNIIFRYDTKKREISVVPADIFSQNPRGVLSDENFITSLTRDFKKEEIKTRLFMYNSEGVGVLAERSAHGQSYLENYDYFKNDDYMSTHLQAAIDTYFVNLEEKESDTESAWAALRILFTEQHQTKNKISDWETDLIDPLTTYDHYQSIQNGFYLDDEEIAEPRELMPDEKVAMDAALAQIEKLNKNIDFYTKGNIETQPRSLQQIEDLIEAQRAILKGLQQESLMPDVFKAYEQLHSLEPGSLMKEMEPYIRDATHQSDSIEDTSSLYRLGLDLLEKISKPRLEFSIDVIDFLEKTELEEFRYLADLGSIIRVENHNVGFLDHVILLKYTHNPESRSLTLEFSNELELRDDTTFLAELISKSNAVSSQVNFQSAFWSGGGVIGTQESDNFRDVVAERIITNRLVAQEIKAVSVVTDRLAADFANIGAIIAESIETGDLTANTAFIEYLNANYVAAERMDIVEIAVANLSADIIDANRITVEYIDTNYMKAEDIRAGFVGAEIVETGRLSADSLAAKYAEVNLLNVDTADFNKMMGNSMVVSEGLFDDLRIVDANILTLNANKINAGTLSVERLVFRDSDIDPESGETKSIIYELNNAKDGLQAVQGETINGEIITDRTIFADKLVAKSITAEEIATGAITAVSGIIKDLDASIINTGTLNAAIVDVVNLDADNITSGSIDAREITITNILADNIRGGSIRGLKGTVDIDLNSGYFNFGDRLISDENGIRIQVGGSTIEDYIEGKMIHRIDAFPAQVAFQANSDGVLLDRNEARIEVTVFRGFEQVLATIVPDTVFLTDNFDDPILSSGISVEIDQPTKTESGMIRMTILGSTNLPSDTGFIRFTVKTVATVNPKEPARTYFYKVGWAKIKSGVDSYSVEVTSTNGNAFKNELGETRLIATVYKGNIDVTSSLDDSRFTWTRKSTNPEADTAWNIKTPHLKYADITSSDVDSSAVFKCSVELE